jgi:hypothetical protein
LKQVWIATLAMIMAIGFTQTSAHQDVPTKVKLQRVFNKGEKQDYTFTIEFKDSPSVKLEGAYTLEVTNVLDGGKAEVNERVTKLKVTFEGEALDDSELPEPETLVYNANGLPEELSDEYDLTSILSYVGAWLPNEEVELGGTYNINWIPSGTSIKVSGKATLIATGRLYEERVAKIEMELKASGNAELGEATIELTSYLNLETGKVVRIHGKSLLLVDGERVNTEFDFRKVRS